MKINEIKNEIKNISSTKQDLKKFGILFGIVFFIITYFLMKNGKSNYFFFGGFGLFFLLSAFLFPKILKLFHKIWMSFALVLGGIMTRVILTLFYIIIFIPYSLILKSFKIQFLDIKINENKNSYWNSRIKKEQTNLHKQF